VADDLALPPVESVPVVTDDGVALEAELCRPPGAVAAVVLAHPHPRHGGSMRSLITSELFTALPAGTAGPPMAALRFNFRGVGGSGGAHGDGVGEALDVEAAIGALTDAVPDLPLVVSGWSFGADVSLSVVDGRIAGWCAVAPPLRVLPPDALLAAQDPRPKLLLVPERDQINPPADAAARTAGWRSTRLEVITGADHFCVGRTDEVARKLAAFASGPFTEHD
jgi:alpha/beta superfamily hydrolase